MDFFNKNKKCHFIANCRFDVESSCFFTPAIHSRIVQFILDRKRFSTNPHNEFAFGIERLLNEKVYVAGYPLHDVSHKGVLIIWFHFTMFYRAISKQLVLLEISFIQNGLLLKDGTNINHWTILRNILVLKQHCTLHGWGFTLTC